MFESRNEPIIPRIDFLWRMARHLILASAIVFGSLAVGVLGYHHLQEMSWMDAFLNASMILGGMGPVTELKHDGAKFFASCYALYSGVVFLVVCGLTMGPLLHRLLHTFHADDDP